LDTSVLFSQTVIDKTALAHHIRQSLQDKSQVSLSELCRTRPLQQGLAELVGYLELAGDDKNDGRIKVVVDESIEDTISWHSEDRQGTLVTRNARLPRVIYLR
jgi:hypothetical protein